jgi:hypothetical protein
MSIDNYVKSKEELHEIASHLLKLAKQKRQCVYRYKQTVYDSSFLERGRINLNRCGLLTTYNAEDLDERIFSAINGEELFPFNIPAFEEWRKREETPFVFTKKGIPLPTECVTDYRDIPTNYEQWDEDLRSFSAAYQNERVTRDFGVKQEVIVNSAGGVIILSRPFFALYYRQGYGHNIVTRSIGAFVSSNQQVNRLPELIAYISDPTPDGKIRREKTFTDAFAALHEVSHRIVYTDLKSANMADHLTHDVIMLSGVPVHEIFGHQFEEPIEPIPVGQQSLFQVGKNVKNTNLILSDNPNLEIAGLEALGSFQFDSYGRRTRKKIHISDAMVQEHLGSEYVDLKNLATFLGVEKSDSVGSARQGNEGNFPQPRMSCTILEGKEIEDISWEGKLLMVPSHGYVLDGNFFKLMASECYVVEEGQPKRICPLEGSRAIYDAIIGMHILPGTSYHIGSCSKPCVLEEGNDSEITVSIYANHQMWENLTLRSL